MFERLFKTKEKQHKYPAVVEEIHSEFSEAADKLLEEAKGIIDVSGGYLIVTAWGDESKDPEIC